MSATPHSATPRPGGGFAWSSLAPLGAVAIWSGNSIVTKSAANVIDPASITLYRWVLAFVLLAPFTLPAVWRSRAIVRRHAVRLALLGVLGMATYQGLAYLAARTTSATDMGVIQALMPLIAALLAGLLSGERLTVSRLLGVGLSLAGVMVMTTHGHPADLFDGADSTGDGLMLIAVTANALYGVLLRRWAIPLSTWQQMLVQIGFTILAVLPFWLAGPMVGIDAGNVGLVLYAGIPASLAAPFCWIVGVKAMGAARASLFMNLLPGTVAVLAFVLLGERLHWFHAIGGAMALTGVTVGLEGWRAILSGSPRRT